MKQTKVKEAIAVNTDVKYYEGYITGESYAWEIIAIVSASAFIVNTVINKCSKRIES